MFLQKSFLHKYVMIENSYIEVTEIFFSLQKTI